MNHEILQASQKDYSKLCKIDTIAQSSHRRKKEIKAAIHEKRCWLVSSSNNVVAYGIVHHQFFGHSFIDLIYVESNARCKGVGTKLIEFFLKNLDGANKVFTSTNQSNSHMQHVLKKLGFTKAGLKEYLDPGDPEIIYVKLQSDT